MPSGSATSRYETTAMTRTAGEPTILGKVLRTDPLVVTDQELVSSGTILGSIRSSALQVKVQVTSLLGYLSLV